MQLGAFLRKTIPAANTPTWMVRLGEMETWKSCRCPICGNLVRRKLDAQGVPTTEIYIMGTAHSS